MSSARLYTQVQRIEQPNTLGSYHCSSTQQPHNVETTSFHRTRTAAIYLPPIIYRYRGPSNQIHLVLIIKHPRSSHTTSRLRQRRFNVDPTSRNTEMHLPGIMYRNNGLSNEIHMFLIIIPPRSSHTALRPHGSNIDLTSRTAASYLSAISTQVQLSKQPNSLDSYHYNSTQQAYSVETRPFQH